MHDSANSYIRPISNRIIRIINTNPIPPLGPYPQDLLCGQVGMAPISISIKKISRMVPIDILFLPVNGGLGSNRDLSLLSGQIVRMTIAVSDWKFFRFRLKV